MGHRSTWTGKSASQRLRRALALAAAFHAFAILALPVHAESGGGRVVAETEDAEPFELGTDDADLLDEDVDEADLFDEVAGDGETLDDEVDDSELFDNEPSAQSKASMGVKAFDLIVVRPLSLTRIVFGFVSFMPAAVFAGPSVGEAWQLFVMDAVEKTFVEPLGDVSQRY